MQLHGVVVLVVLRHIGAGDQYSGASHGFQFGQRQRTGAADDEVCRCQQLRHIVDVFLYHKAVARGKALLLLQLLKQLHPVLPGGVQVQHRLVLVLLPCAQVCHHLVDPACAQAAAEGQDDGAVARTQLCTDGLSIRGLYKHLRPHGIAHHKGLVRCAQLFHSGGHGGKHDIHIRGQQLVGHTGKSVLLMQGGVDAHFGGAAHHRAGHIAAAADDKIRLYLFHHGLGLGTGEGQIPQGNDIALDVVQAELALKPGDLDVVEGVARLCDQTVLHALLAAGKVDLGGGVCFFQGTCNGKCGVDMAGRTTGSNQNTHTNSPFSGRIPLFFSITELLIL